MPVTRTILKLSALLATAAMALSASPAISQQVDCRVGTYRLTDGSDVDVGPRDRKSVV